MIGITPVPLGAGANFFEGYFVGLFHPPCSFPSPLDTLHSTLPNPPPNTLGPLKRDPTMQF